MLMRYFIEAFQCTVVVAKDICNVNHWLIRIRINCTLVFDCSIVYTDSIQFSGTDENST